MADERTPTTVSPTGRNAYDVAKNKGKEKSLRYSYRSATSQLRQQL